MTYSFNQLLQEIANGKREITIQLPNLEPIKGIITDINLQTPNWKPFKVKIIRNDEGDMVWCTTNVIMTLDEWREEQLKELGID